MSIVDQSPHRRPRGARFVGAIARRRLRGGTVSLVQHESRIDAGIRHRGCARIDTESARLRLDSDRCLTPMIRLGHQREDEAVVLRWGLRRPRLIVTRQCLGRLLRPRRHPARSGSVSTRSDAGIARARSASSGIPRTGASSAAAEVERLRADEGVGGADGAQPLPRRRALGRDGRAPRARRDRRHRAGTRRGDRDAGVGRRARAPRGDERRGCRQVDERDGGAMTRPLSRRRVLTVAAGTAAIAALPVRPASPRRTRSSPTRTSPCPANCFRQICTRRRSQQRLSSVRSGRTPGRAQGSDPARQRVFRSPHRRRPGCADRRGLRLPVAGEGVCHARRDRRDRDGSSSARCSALTRPRSQRSPSRATGSFTQASPRSAGQQLGALSALGASGVVEPFPVALDLESASDTLEPYLG